MRESLILWWAFGFMTVKSRIWWAFLTGTATKCRKIAVVPGAPSSHSLTLMWSISIRFVHQVQLKTELIRSEICGFRGYI